MYKIHREGSNQNPNKNHKEGSNQRLKRAEAKDRNHDKIAMAADIWYLLQSFVGQFDPLVLSRRSTTLAVEEAAASVRMDNTYYEIYWISTNGCQQLYYVVAYNSNDHPYPISYNNDQQYSWLPNRTFNQNRVSIHQCQSETPRYNQTHDCHQVAVSNISIFNEDKPS